MEATGTSFHSHRAFLLFGLLVECPYYGWALESCPLRHFRGSKCLEEKFFLAEQWDESELEEILAAHNRCYWRRVRSALYRPGCPKKMEIRQ